MIQKYENIANNKIFLRLDLSSNFEISFVTATFSQIEDDAHNQYLSICDIHDCYEYSENFSDPEDLDSNKKKVREFIALEYSNAFKHNISVLQGIKGINFALMNELFVKVICEHTHINSQHTYYLLEDYFGNVTCESANTFDFFELAVGFVKMKPSVLFLKSINTYSDTEEGVRNFLKDAKKYGKESEAEQIIGPEILFKAYQIEIEKGIYELTKLGEFYLNGVMYKKKIIYREGVLDFV